MFAGRVVISAVIGGVHCVALDPPMAGLIAVQQVPSFSQAVGLALGHAIALSRTVIDETGTLTPAQLSELQIAFVADGLDYAFKNPAKALAAIMG